MDTKSNAASRTAYIQIFGPVKCRQQFIDCLARHVPFLQHSLWRTVTLGGSTAFHLRDCMFGDADVTIHDIPIGDHLSKPQQRVRAAKFASSAALHDDVFVIYIPGQMAALELDSFLRAVNRPVVIYALPRRDGN